MCVLWIRVIVFRVFKSSGQEGESGLCVLWVRVIVFQVFKCSDRE